MSLAYNHFTASSNARLLNILHVTVFNPIPFSASIEASAKLLKIQFVLKNQNSTYFTPYFYLLYPSNY